MVRWDDTGLLRPSWDMTARMPLLPSCSSRAMPPAEEYVPRFAGSRPPDPLCLSNTSDGSFIRRTRRRWQRSSRERRLEDRRRSLHRSLASAAMAILNPGCRHVAAEHLPLRSKSGGGPRRLLCVRRRRIWPPPAARPGNWNSCVLVKEVYLLPCDRGTEEAVF